MHVHKDALHIYMKVKRLFYNSQEVFFTSPVKVINEKGI